jgi:hypothetical protein
MSLLAPALLAGLIGLALPVLAHLLGRERPKEIRFAAMRFLPDAEPTVTHRRAIQDWPLLLLRLLLLALLVLALARPATFDRGGVTVVAEVHDAVVLVDGSRSMGLRIDDDTVLERAAERVYALLDSLPPGSRVGLLTSDPGGPQVEPTADPDRVRAALEGWLETDEPRPGAWTLREAIPQAAAMLRDLGDEGRKKVIYAVGDATEGGLGELPAAAEGGAIVVPIPALDDDALPEHVGIKDVSWEPAPDLDPRAVRIQAVVRRHAGTNTADDTLELAIGLYLGDTEVARTIAELAPDEDTPVEFTHTLLDEEEVAAATVALIDRPDDALPSDDRRHLWLSADDGIEVAVVNGDPSELRAHDEVFFLTTAVAAADEDRSVRLRSVAPDQLEDSIRKRGAAALDDTEVLVLANVRAPSPDIAPAIIERVQAGMGLLISVGERVEPDAYNKRLGPVLPLRMREAVQVGTAPGRTEARAEGVAPADLSHPAFRGLGGDLGLSGAQARRIMLLEPDPRRETNIALSFTSGAPALLTQEIGDGRVALLTTTVDRDWADLPLRPGFVPLITGTLAWLGGAGGGLSGSRIAVGEPRRLRTDEPVVITTPDGREVSVAPEDGVATFHDTFVPGHYRSRVGDDSNLRSVFAVDVDPIESDTHHVEVREAELGEAGEHVAITVPRWRWLVLLAAALLACEAVLRFRQRGLRATV